MESYYSSDMGTVPFKDVSIKTKYLGLLFFVILGVAGYFFVTTQVRNSVTDEFTKREQTVAAAQASNLTAFFQDFGRSMAIFAQLGSLGEEGQSAETDMEGFMSGWEESGLIGGLILANSQGVVKFNVNVTRTPDTGKSIADRDYFVWARDEGVPGDYYIGHPVVSRLGASQGKTIVPLATPVYSSNTFKGIMSASVELEPLTNRFLGLMNISENTAVYLVGDDNRLLYTSEGIAELGSQFTLFDDVSQTAIDKTQAGAVRTKEHLIVYSPVDLGNEKWLLVMSTPDKEIERIVTPLYIRQVAILLLAYLFVFLFGIIASRETSLMNKEEKED